MSAPTKRCPTCGQTKPLTAFYREARQPDGHAKHCAACERRRVAATRARQRAAAMDAPRSGAA